MQKPSDLGYSDVICRVGSLEMWLRNALQASISYLPSRQFRNAEINPPQS